MKNIEEEKKAMILERKLFCASAIGDIEVVDLLLDRGAEVSGKTNSGSTPLHYAAWFGHADVVALLLDRWGGGER